MTQLHQLLTEKERDKLNWNNSGHLLNNELARLTLQDFSNIFFVLEEFQVKVPEGFCCVMAMLALCNRAERKNLDINSFH